MNEERGKEGEFIGLLDRFSHLIRAHILKFNLSRYGLDPEDIAQDVRIKIWKLLESEKKVSNYASYIRKIVDSSVIDQLRKFRREEGIYNHEKQRQIAEQELEYCQEVSRLKNLEEIIGRTVESLLASRRQAVKLYLLNLSIQEIADYLGWTADKTRNLLYRGLADLKKKLRELEIDYEIKQ